MIFHPLLVLCAFRIEVEPHEDDRGYFARTWCHKEFAQAGIHFSPIQTSLSFNKLKGTLRGVHFQRAPYVEAKIVQCLRGRLFDVIILKDVIEHIHDQGKFIQQLRGFLAPDGVVFFAYPPWWMPFGGHQQICNAKLLRTLPWFHLLPKLLYKGLLQLFNERPANIADLLEVKETGINIEKMRRLLRENNYTILDQKFWLFNPIYKFKFGINKKLVWQPLTMLPYIRNFYTTAHYVVFCPKS